MFGLGYQEFLVILVILAIFGLPPAVFGTRVARRAGFSPAWAWLLLLPPTHLVMLWVFAFVRWPVLDRPNVTPRPTLDLQPADAAPVDISDGVIVTIVHGVELGEPAKTEGDLVFGTHEVQFVPRGGKDVPSRFRYVDLEEIMIRRNRWGDSELVVGLRAGRKVTFWGDWVGLRAAVERRDELTKAGLRITVR